MRPSTPCSPHVMIPTPSALTATFERSTPVPAFAPGSTSAGTGTSAHAFVRRSRRATTTFPAWVNVAYATLLIDMSAAGSVPAPSSTGAPQGWSPATFRLA